MAYIRTCFFPKASPFSKKYAEVGSKVTVKKGAAILGVATADRFGKFTITLKTLQKAKTVLAVTAADKANNVSKAAYVTVKDRTAPSVPKVKSVTKRSTSVTGKAEPSSKVYVKLGSKVIGSATTDKKGNFKVKIKKQRAGKTIYVYAKDPAGNTSKSAKLKVKK
ncbi:Ig-like domain-containing protein [Bacillus sp. X1(2014)]|uniref:Ig-like domain-containing protein n=1 Tax=Bacillus sp. X1(2014) TaxID=1565991 RepID=UPI00119FA71B|nr:Ig-like domain-containing protein [Bacillus sp. X1(2014)]